MIDQALKKLRARDDLSPSEFYERFKVVEMTDGTSYPLPLTQIDLAECLGSTPIHVNRTLRELRLRKLVTFRSKRVVID